MSGMDGWMSDMDHLPAAEALDGQSDEWRE